VAGAMAPAIEAVTAPSPVRAGTGNASRFPRPRGTVPRRSAGPGEAEASARPGGGEAPAVGGAGAGRGLWVPGGCVISRALWQRRWPLPWHPGPAFRPFGREQEAHHFSPARARRCPGDRQVRAHRQASSGTGCSVAPRQVRWPLPGCSRRMQAHGFPALRSGSPCGWHVSTFPLRRARPKRRKSCQT
jgi:hypothetical protein